MTKTQIGCHVLTGIAFVASVFFAQASYGQQPKTNQTAPSMQPSVTTASYENWTLRCVNLQQQRSSSRDVSCEVVQVVQLQGQQQPIAHIAIGTLPNDKALILTAVLPNNIALPSTVTISKDTTKLGSEGSYLSLDWRRCLPTGCFADGKPSPTFLSKFDVEKEGSIAFIDGAGRAVAIPLSWKGLSAALEALRAK